MVSPPGNCIKDLATLGYCVIPVLSEAEAENLNQRVWSEYIEKAWPGCKRDDRSNWAETFPQQNNYGLLGGRVGQIQALWDLRQDPRIIAIFAKIWGTNELIVSMEGISLVCPPEIKQWYFEYWPYLSQQVGQKGCVSPPNFVCESSIETKPYMIRGQVLFEDSFGGDGGFFCIPGSHREFNAFAPLFEEKLKELIKGPHSWEEQMRIRREYIFNFFKKKDADGNPYRIQHVIARRGSLIVWDARVIHWNQHPSLDRPYCNPPRVQMVAYLCYVPKKRLTEKAKETRKQAFNEGCATTHDPAFPELLREETMRNGRVPYSKPSDYVFPKIVLGDLGHQLLGIGQAESAEQERRAEDAIHRVARGNIL